MAAQDADVPQEVTEDCIFCRIAQGDDENTVPLYQDDEIVIFHDIRPSSTNHFLVCTTQHIRDASRLNKSHIPMVEHMIAVSKRLLEERGADFSQARLGFHWPPFHVVAHLHLHVICPVGKMGLLSRVIFWPRSCWFVTVDWLLEKLKNMPEEPSSNDTGQGSSTGKTTSQKASQLTGADTSDDSSHYETGRESSNGKTQMTANYETGRESSDEKTQMTAHYETGRESSDEKTQMTSQKPSRIAGQDTLDDIPHDEMSHDTDLVQETVHRTEDNET